MATALLDGQQGLLGRVMLGMRHSFFGYLGLKLAQGLAIQLCHRLESPDRLLVDGSLRALQAGGMSLQLW